MSAKNGGTLPRFKDFMEAFDHVERSISVECPKMRIRVTEPEQSGGLMSKYVTYLVHTEPFGYVVRRRFSDFCWLRETLMKRYVGMLVPSLPRKSVIGTAATTMWGSEKGGASEFLKKRMRLLGIFFENVVSIPFLRTDPALKAFLSLNNDKEWETIRSSAEISKELVEENSLGCVKWRQLMTEDVSQTVQHVERVLMNFARQLDRLEQVLGPLSSGCKLLAEKSFAFNSEMLAIKGGLADWGELEKDISDAVKWEFPNKTAKNLVELLHGSVSLFESWSKILGFQPLVLEHLFHDALQYLEQQIDSMRELLKSRDKAMKEKAKLERDLANLMRDKSRGPNEVGGISFFSLNTTQHTEKDIIKFIEEKEGMVRISTRALFFSEIDRFNAQRTAILKGVLSQLGACTIQSNKKINTVWSDAMKALDLDMDEGVERARAVMASTLCISKSKCDDKT